MATDTKRDAKSEAGEIETAKKSRRFDDRDFDTMAELIKAEKERRKQRRKHIEKQWKEIDRQLRMEPDLTFKMDANGQISRDKTWMPELELPLQAQTLEVLTADARQMMFPDSASWFTAHAALTDDYLRRVDFQAIIAGDELEVPSQFNQDNADKLVEGYLTNFHSKYDFCGTWDRLNAEAFKYGTFVGYGRMATQSTFTESANGTLRKDAKIPVLVPMSVKNVYLDDTVQNMMHAGMMVAPAVIRCEYRSLKDLQLEAQKGSTDPDDMDGGWMPPKVKSLQADDNGNVEILEWTGDMVIPRKTVRSLFLPNVIVTVAVGKNQKVVRLRFNPYPFSPYLIQPYHVEGANEVYGTGPLMKGMPIQKVGTESLNRLAQWAILNTEPPIKYSKDDPSFAQTGGPVVAPRELWPTMGEVEPVNIGDGAGLLQMYGQFLQQYADVTGVNAPRLGAQTKSHTTAYSKEIETAKGQARTVDYVKTVLKAPATRWLHMEYEMGRSAMKGESTFFIQAYGGWVTIDKSKLPDRCEFEAHGAGQPAEQREKEARRLSSLQLAMQIDAMKVQSGLGQPMNYEALQREILTQGGWTDVDVFLTPGGAANAGGIAGQPGVPGVDPALAATLPAALASRV